MRRVKPIYILLGSLAVLLLLGAAVASLLRQQPGNDGQTASPARLKIIVSIFPLADICRQLAGERAEVVTLLPPGASPHTFEPTPSLVRKVSGVDIFVSVGAGLDTWAGKVVEAAGTKSVEPIVLAESFDLIAEVAGEHAGEEGPEHDGAATEDEEHGHGHERAANPHIWLDPLLVWDMAGRITASLIKADPEGKAYYQARNEAYCAELVKLDRELAAATASFKTKEYVSFHDAWPYFAHRYGLRSAGVIAEAPGREPTPGRVRAIVESVKRYRIRAVFTEPQFAPAIAQAIAEGTGAAVVCLDPLGGEGLPGRDGYIPLMRWNLERMRQAMGNVDE